MKYIKLSENCGKIARTLLLYFFFFTNIAKWRTELDESAPLTDSGSWLLFDISKLPAPSYQLHASQLTLSMKTSGRSPLNAQRSAIAIAIAGRRRFLNALRSTLTVRRDSLWLAGAFLATVVRISEFLRRKLNLNTKN